MAFMEPQVYETDYLHIDGPMGGEVIPCDVADIRVEDIGADVQLKANGAYWEATTIDGAIDVPDALQPYCENTKVWVIERAHGFIARMSAPGYTDATEWAAFNTEAEARGYLAQMYGDEED